MKKFYAIVFSAILVACVLTACGGSNDVPNDALKIVDSGWNCDPTYGFINYSVEITNADESKTYQSPTFKVTAYDSNDKAIGSVEQTLPEIKAGQTVAYAAEFTSDGTPDHVDVELTNYKSSNWIPDDEGMFPDITEPLSAIDVNAGTSGIGIYKCTGQIANENKQKLEEASVTVVFKNSEGKIIGGYTETVKDIKPNGNTPFEIEVLTWLNVDDYEVFVSPGAVETDD